MPLFRCKIISVFILMTLITLAYICIDSGRVFSMDNIRLYNHEQSQNAKDASKNHVISNYSDFDIDDVDIVVSESGKYIEVLGSLNTTAIDNRTESSSVLKEIISEINETVTVGQNEINKTASGDNRGKIKNGNDIKRIVLYHFYHTALRWAAKVVDMKKCHHYKNCEIVYHDELTNETLDADAVVIQGNNIPQKYPTRLDTNQAFVYLNIESPQYLQHAKMGNPFYKAFFNWTMTYRQDSDIPYLYGSVISLAYNKTIYLATAEKMTRFQEVNHFRGKLLRSDIDGKNYSSVFRKKKKSSVWLASHCKTYSKRELYVSRLKTYIDIDVIGTCSKTRNNCPKGNLDCKADIINTYKFILAFENSVCEDYITEKVFSWITKDIIVVVRGARFYKRYLPDDTYIDADDYKTKEDLANYLAWLGANEKEYIKYLKKKDKYTVISEQEHVQLAYCNLCYKLNNLHSSRRLARPLEKWWITDKCVKPLDYIF